MENENKETQINLIEVFKSLLKKWWIIVASCIFCTFVAFVYLYKFKPQEYEASIRLYVNNNSLSLGSAGISISSSDISANRSLVDSYAVILTSNSTLEKIFDEANIVDDNDVSRNKYKTLIDDNGHYQYDYDYLRSLVSVSAIDDTEIFQITFTCEDKKDVEILATTTIYYYPDIVEDIIEGSKVAVVDNVKTITAVSKGYTKYCIIAFLVGLVLSCGAIFVYDFFINDTITSSDYIASTYESIPLLAIIPDTNAHSRSKYGKYYYYKRRKDYYQNYYENDEEEAK